MSLVWQQRYSVNNPRQLTWVAFQALEAHQTLSRQLFRNAYAGRKCNALEENVIEAVVMQTYINEQVAERSEFLGFQHFPTRHIPAHDLNYWFKFCHVSGGERSNDDDRKYNFYIAQWQFGFFFSCFGSALAHYRSNCLFASRDFGAILGCRQLIVLTFLIRLITMVD